MEPVNNNTAQNPQNPVVNPAPTQAPVPPLTPIPAPIVPGPENSGSSNKNLIILIVVGLIVLIVLGGVLFYFMSSRPSNNPETSALPVVSVTPSSEATDTTSSIIEVQGVSDLDSLLFEVANADSSLEKELESLEKDSNF